MLDMKETASVFDAWVKTLSPEEQVACQRAVKNAVDKLSGVGEASAKELVVAVLLKLKRRR